MKFAIIIPDGCADRPIDALGNRTPMQVARTPNLDTLAKSGVVGRSFNVPESLSPGSDVATLSLLGYDPLVSYSGRAPLEAAALGIDMQPTDWAFRCNTVTVEQGVMRDFTAGHLSNEEAAELMGCAQRELADKTGLPIRFHPGVGYRNLMLWTGAEAPFDEETRTWPPHDLTDRPVADYPVSGPGADILKRLSKASAVLLAEHPVNRRRRDAGKTPCTHWWLWGQGRRPSIETFAQRFGVPSGAMITAVDLLRGIGKYLGWDIVDVPGATGYVDTDYAAKGRYAAEALRTHEIVCVHIEAPDESGHEGDAVKKVRALEEIDGKVVPPILDALRTEGAKSGGWRLLVSPDHPTPCAIKTHTRGFAPWLWAGNDVEPDGAERYDEETAECSSRLYSHGFQMMRNFLAAQK